MSHAGRPTSRPWAKYIKSRVQEAPVGIEELVTAASRLVPPGQAYRRRLSLNVGRSQSKGKVYDENGISESAKDRLIESGQRHIVIGTIRMLRLTGRVLVEGEGENRVVKIGPNRWPD